MSASDASPPASVMTKYIYNAYWVWPSCGCLVATVVSDVAHIVRQPESKALGKLARWHIPR